MKSSVYAWCVLNPKAPAGMRWQIFRSRQKARDHKAKHGGDLFKIVRVR